MSFTSILGHLYDVMKDNKLDYFKMKPFTPNNKALFWKWVKIDGPFHVKKTIHYHSFGMFPQIFNNGKTVIGFGRPGAHFDMIHNHMTWNEKFVKDHMPNDTFKFSIIRHPVSHLTSSWKYFFQSTHHVSARKIF